MSLGKGLSALISEDAINSSQREGGYIADLPIEYISPNPYQPRSEIKPETLVELADSIREHGIIEPLLVSKKGENKYELIAGERRLRAAKLAKITRLPVVVKEASAQQMLELAIVENLQRKDLNPIEEALAFEQLQKLFNVSVSDMSRKLGVSRPAVANKLRLLALPESIKKYLIDEKLSEGHARALLGLRSRDAMVAAADIAARDSLSVRAVEELVRRLNQTQKPTEPPKKSMLILDSYTQKLETDLKSRFGDGVKLFRSLKGGKIVIPFASDDELKKIYEILN